ncbi:hypothetical protein C485_13125 [Natrinema altunense JCM 12890]|uniref:Uncharacterized protein n=1 Tax=Natrinema altunense (strain JCM 12890 / CGMCC 1.3731 / AJ2) TaxID=1227494 RepID=L9ZJ73_NATA2|nr:hypothetical protein C485_13125 [Natrinema altunense JCM 12890]
MEIERDVVEAEVREFRPDRLDELAFQRSLEPSTAVPTVPAPPVSGDPFTAMTDLPVNSVPDG